MQCIQAHVADKQQHQILQGLICRMLATTELSEYRTWRSRHEGQCASTIPVISCDGRSHGGSKRTFVDGDFGCQQYLDGGLVPGLDGGIEGLAALQQLRLLRPNISASL